jgi:FAD:protein FMN transferase
MGLWRTGVAGLLAAALLAVASPACGRRHVAAARGERQAAAGVEIQRRLALMGTWLEVHLEADDRPRALAASEAAVRALEAAEARLSTWHRGSELDRLNRTPAGVPCRLSPALAAELAAARRCWQETGGAFDPAIGPLVSAWGLRHGGRKPSSAELRRAVAASDMAALALGPDGWATRRRSDLVLEEGAWGKGAGLVAAVAAIAAVAGARSAAIDLGGQVAVWSRVAGGGTWAVPVADPARRQRAVLTVAIHGGSLSTSGDSERGVEVGGERFGHIIDPDRGVPAADFGSLTVWHADPLVADCLSTGLYVMGPRRALAWAALHPGVEVLVLEPAAGRLRALATPGLRGRLTPLVADLDLVEGGSRAGRQPPGETRP